MFLRENKPLRVRPSNTRTKQVHFHERVLVRVVPRWSCPKHDIWIKGRDVLASRAEYVRLRRLHNNAVPKVEPFLDDETGWCCVRHGSDPAQRARSEHLDLIPYYYGHLIANNSAAGTGMESGSPPKKPLRRASYSGNGGDSLKPRSIESTQAIASNKTSAPLQEKPSSCATCQQVECRCRRRPFGLSGPQQVSFSKSWECPSCKVQVLESKELCPLCNSENVVNSPPLKNPHLPVPKYRWV